MLTTVKVPEQFVPVFEKAQEYVGRYFKEKKEDPSKGTIEIFGERYILVRAASMSVEFFETVANLYEKEGEEEARNIARQILFDVAHAVGKQDAENFHKKMNLKEPIEKLSAGPVHFSHTGWAFVDIFPESRLSPDENFLLIYDHPYAFESAAWIASGRKSTFPVCIMNAGYSSGWCEESFGVTLVSSEIMCRAKGDKACRFIMAPPSKIEGHIADYMKREPELATRISNYEVPGFFKRKEMEDKLRQSEERYRGLIEAARDTVFTLSPEGVITSLNRAFEEMTGWSRSEWIGRYFVEGIAFPEDIPLASQTMKKMLLGEVPPLIIVRFRTKSGGYFWSELNMTPRYHDGRVTDIMGFARNVTERKEMEESLKKQEAEWRHTFDSISDFISIQDKDFRIIKVNKSLADFLGMTPEEISGKHCYEILHGKTEPWPTCPHVATLQSGKSETREVDDPRIGRSLLVTTSPIFDEKGTIIGSVHIAKDVTERRKMENEREELLKESERINKELNDFAYIISHDLKEPLRGIMQLSHWITEDYNSMLDEEGKKKLSLLMERAKRMHNMIDGVLQYSRAGRVMGEATAVDTGSIIRQAVDMLSPTPNIAIKVRDGLPEISGDPVKVCQVFQNLIGNALKYMDKPEGLVEIGCRDAGDSWEFFVQDNGPGIEERHFERIFQMFQSLRKEEESTGIGLTIAKKIVEQNGGRIWVESKAGMGSIFRFTWPKK